MLLKRFLIDLKRFPKHQNLDKKKKKSPEPRAHVKFMMCAVYFGPGEVEVPLNPAQSLLLSNRF